MDPARWLHQGKVDRVLEGFVDLLWRYFRVEVEGEEHLPAQGSALVVPNHSGYAGADAILLAHYLHRRQGRVPHILAHPAFFEWFAFVRRISESFGLEQATHEHGMEALKRGETLMIFPEAEIGNFKPSSQRYRLQPFHTGFVRMAIRARAPVIPTLVIGAEESHLCLGRIDLTRFSERLHLPVPLNLLPLPAKWKIVFLPAVELGSFADSAAEDYRALKRVASDIRRKMQRELWAELSQRRYVYFRGF